MGVGCGFCANLSQDGEGLWWGEGALTYLRTHRSSSFSFAHLVTYDCGSDLCFVCACSDYREMSGLGQGVRSPQAAQRAGQAGRQRLGEDRRSGGQRGHVGKEKGGTGAWGESQRETAGCGLHSLGPF